jgi:archaeosine synthase beta-subunit
LRSRRSGEGRLFLIADDPCRHLPAGLGSTENGQEDAERAVRAGSLGDGGIDAASTYNGVTHRRTVVPEGRLAHSQPSGGEPLPPTVLPDPPVERDRWVVGRRGPRTPRDAYRAYAHLVEPELGPSGALQDVAALFLTNRECPFRCVMCDLWRDTLPESVPIGAIPAQIDAAVPHLAAARVLKLYNAGSFFDPRAIPPADYPAIAARLDGFERVIVECHPGFLGRRCLEFRDLLPPGVRLEVAMGLETAHPVVLERLNKRMTLDQFADAARFLRTHDLDLRVFILVRPPWLTEAEGIEWAVRSVRFAAECGAAVSALIPTRGGNGALEALAAAGEFAEPQLASVEEALERSLREGHRRVFADLWDLQRFAGCPHCAGARIMRIREMTLTQSVPPPLDCRCGDEG